MGVGFGVCVSDGAGFAVGFLLGDADSTGTAEGVVVGGVAPLGAEVAGFVDDAVGFRSVSLVGWEGLGSSVAFGFDGDPASCGRCVGIGVGEVDFVGRGWAAGFGEFVAGPAAMGVFDAAA